MKLDDAQEASRDQFSRQSDRYGKSHILSDVTDVEKAIAKMALPDNADVLDVATGGGHTAHHLANLGHRVTAADISQAMLDQTLKDAEEKSLSLQTSLQPAESFPQDDASLDLVTCRVAAHHFSDPAAFVRESARVLKPSGWLAIIDGSVDDDQPIAEDWTHQVEKLRDPSHGRFITPNSWRGYCEAAGLEVTFCELQPMKQPDLMWYFETANTSPENREAVLKLIKDAPQEARDLFGITEEDGKIVWWWRRMTLVAQRPAD